jgi:hypothetical protein
VKVGKVSEREREVKEFNNLPEELKDVTPISK